MPTFARFKVFLHREQLAAGKRRARELGYRSYSEYLRCLITQELRAPRLGSARSVYGRPARELSLARPKRHSTGGSEPPGSVGGG